jgi:hypothetical protein
MVQQWADFLDDLEAGKLPVHNENVLRFVRPKGPQALCA